MGEVVLHPEERQARFLGVPGGEVIGVGVAHDVCGSGVVQALEVGNDAIEGVGCLDGFEVADVLADEDVLADGEGDAVLEVGADGQRWCHGSRELDREGSITPGAAQYHLAAQEHAHDRVVYVADNGAVVDQEEVGDAGKALQRVVLVGANRLVGEVAAGGHDGEAELGHEEVMQGGVGEHDAKVWATGSDAVGDLAGGGAPFEEHDGQFGGSQQASLGL